MRYLSRGVGVLADGSGGGRRGTALQSMVLLLAVIVAGVVVLSAVERAERTEWGAGYLRVRRPG